MVTAKKPATPSTEAPKPVVKTAAKPVASTKTSPTKTARSNVAKPAQTKPVKAAETAAPKAPAPKVEKKAKPEKVKVVRDSFTIPKSEYAAIADMKKRALALGTEVKKSELIRAGLALLAASSNAAFSKALAQVPTLKTGRPGKD